LLQGSSSTVLEHPPHARDGHAPWFDAAAPEQVATPSATTQHDLELRDLWDVRASEAAISHSRPVAFTDASAPRVLWGKQGRYGTRFGETVHLGIGLALRSGLSIEDSIARAALHTRLSAHLEDAVADVRRALVTLGTLGVGPGTHYRLEYAVAGLRPAQALVAGYADFVAVLGGRIVLLDFKTDAPPPPAQPPPQPYVDQVQGYVDVLASAFGSPIRGGLLFTADGSVRWLSSGDNA
jgi:hypothetical protein